MTIGVEDGRFRLSSTNSIVMSTEPSPAAASKPTIVLTGVKPTGLVHLGNYVGAIRPALAMAAAPGIETWLFIADYHALTSAPDPKEFNEWVYRLAATWLACGLDPERTVFYRQSDVPEIMEINWILSCFTPKGLMNRAHAYKARVQENEEFKREDLDHGVNMGLFNYPILMSADILAFGADRVPVGEDQVQHLEIARDIAQKLNRRYGPILRLPQVVVGQKGKSIPGLDGRKMSKSYDNYIPLFEESARLKKIIGRIKTDSLPPEAPKPIEGSLIFELFECFAEPAAITALRAEFEAGISWGTAKAKLFEAVDAAIAPMRADYNRRLNDRPEIDRILATGAARARARAGQTLSALRRAAGLRS